MKESLSVETGRDGEEAKLVFRLKQPLNPAFIGHSPLMMMMMMIQQSENNDEDGQDHNDREHGNDSDEKLR